MIGNGKLRLQITMKFGNELATYEAYDRLKNNKK